MGSDYGIWVFILVFSGLILFPLIIWRRKLNKSQTLNPKIPSTIQKEVTQKDTPKPSVKEEDIDTSMTKGESMLEEKIDDIDIYLSKSNGVEIEETKLNVKDPTQLIKNHYLIEGEQDKFTKTTEYQTRHISFKSDLVDNYVKSKSDFGIGGALINFSLLYRKKGEEDACLIELKITYITTEDYFSNPNILKDLKIIFLCDGEPIELSDQTAHDFGAGKYTGL